MILGEVTITDYISTTVAALLISGMAFFFKKFADTVEDLKQSVEALKIIMSAEQEKIKSTKESVTEVKDEINDKVGVLTDRVDRIEKDVAVLKAMETEHHGNGKK